MTRKTAAKKKTAPKKRSARKTEAAFLLELRDSVNQFYPESFWYKIPDMPVFGGMNTRFAPKKPFDVIWLYRGGSAAIEAKVHPDSKAWSTSAVQPHQLEALLKAKSAGSRALIVLNVRYGLGAARFNKAFILTVDEFVALRTPKAGKLGGDKPADRSLSLDELHRFKVMDWHNGSWGVADLIDDVPAGF